jgi:hypothetical protein
MIRVGRVVGWTTFVGILWVSLAASFADDETCSWICFTFGDMLALLFFPASIVWALGLIVMYIVGRLRRRRLSSDAGATTGTH